MGRRAWWRRGSMRRIRRLLMAGSLLLASAPMVAAVQTAHAGTQQTYLVVYSQQAVPAGASASISSAGGTLVASYDAIGVAVARSDSSAFRDNVMADSKVEGVAATGGFATQLNDGGGGDTTPSTATADPAPAHDNLSNLHRGQDQNHTP